MWIRGQRGGARAVRHICAMVSVGAVLAVAAPAAFAQGSGVTVTFAQGVDPAVLDPARETTVTAISVMTNIYDSLVWLSPEGKMEPGLAESWEFRDPRTLILHLRHGVTFHNGDPFTAADVVFTLMRYIDPKAQYQILPQASGLYTDVVALDDYTVQITSAQPVATLVGMLCRLLMLPKAALTSMGEAAFGQHPIGTGPYRMTRWKKNEEIDLDAYPGYWRGKAKIDHFVVKPIPEDYSRFAALKSGELDLISDLPPERAKEVEKLPGLKVIGVRSGRNYMIPMNVANAPYSDVRVRRALNHAVDVQGIIDTVLDGRAYANPAACAGGTTGNDPDLKPYAYDPALAKKLLAEAGYPNGFTTDLWGAVGHYTKDKEVQEAIAGQLAAVGVTVRHVQPEHAAFLAKFLKGEIPTMVFEAVGNPILDCDYAMGQRIDSKRGGRMYQNPEVDAMIAAERREVDPVKRAAIFKNIQQKLHDDAAWIFLYDGQDLYGAKARLQWKPRPDEAVWAYGMSLAQ